MKTTTALFGALILIAGAASPALAVTTHYDISGLMVESDSNCPSPVPIFNQDDCSYNASNPTGSFIAEWIGPLFNAGYYAPGTSPGPAIAGANDPVPGDGKMSPVIAGTVAIDDQGSAAGTDDTIDATIVIGQTVRNFGAGARGTAEEAWTSLTMKLGPVTARPVAVTSATANANGGFDYVIGSLGMPPRLVDAATGLDFWPSETGPDSDSAVGLGHYWAAPSPIGIAPIEANASIGTTATFTASGYSCIDTQDGIGGAASACDAKGRMGDGVTGGGQDFENIILSLSTDGGGNITSASLVWVQQQDVIFPVGPDSWVAGVIDFSGVLGGAQDDAYSVEKNSANNLLNIGANDTIFGNPTTATISLAPDHGGVAVMQNSPGNPAAINVNYAPAPGFSGTETFQYTMDDGSVTDTATVTIVVLAPEAVDDIANVIEGETVEIAVIANDTPGSGALVNHTVQITRQPNVGSASVVEGNVVSYTAVAGSHGNDSLEYTLTDKAGSVSDPATVQIGIGLARSPTPAGGVSALGLWNLLLLGGALVWRRRRADGDSYAIDL